MDATGWRSPTGFRRGSVIACAGAVVVSLSLVMILMGPPAFVASVAPAPSAGSRSLPSAEPPAGGDNASVGQARVDKDCHVGPLLVPTCGALWGAYSPPPSTVADEDWSAGYRALEQAVGRRLDVVKRYHDFSNQGGNGAFPDQHERSLAAEGRILFLAWVSHEYHSGESATWADVAAGRYDADVVDPVATRLRDFGAPVFLDLDHEVDGRRRASKGSSEDYVRAFRHVRERFRVIGADNVVFVYTVSGTMSNASRVKAAYPGDDVVDWIGFDPYNWADCRQEPFRNFEEVVDPFYDWLMANGHKDKPLILSEYGSSTSLAEPDARRQWFGSQVAVLREHPNLKAVVYYNSDGICAGPTTTALWQDPGALAAFGKSGADQYFGVLDNGGR